MIDNVEYSFYPWGPYLFKTTINKLLCEELLKKGKELKESATKDLAGHINDQRKFKTEDINWFVEKTSKIFEMYLETSKTFYGKKLANKLNLQSLWINFMKKGEFNPTHIHTADLSFVLFLNIPEELSKEQENYKGTDETGPGGLSFFYGEGVNEKIIVQNNFKPKTGDFFIFPANLRHSVYPFKSDIERISVSGNLYFIK